MSEVYAKRARTKLTPELVIQIRQKLKDGAGNQELATEMNLNRQTVQNIRSGLAWKNVGMNGGA